MRLFLSDSPLYFGDAYSSVKDLLSLLRGDFDLLVDVLCRLKNYMGSLKAECERLIEAVISFFFEDFSNSESSKRDLHLFLKKIVEVSFS